MLDGDNSARVRYGVFHLSGGWTLFRGQSNLGRYADQIAAIAAGKRAISDGEHDGAQAELLIVETFGELVPVDYGRIGQ